MSSPLHIIRYCSSCVNNSVSVNLTFNNLGVCSACVLQEQMNTLSPEFWELRQKKWLNLVENAKQKSELNYDCIVPVSGGKDSYFQVHKALKYGLKPLLVTYHGNNYLPEGQRNLDRMRDVLGVDHIVFGPSVDTLKKLNRSGFEIMGDMNWHCHAGIKIFPMQLAVRLKIPLVIWGEITWSVAGMFDMDDYVQYNKRTVFEHDMRGYRIEDIVERTEGLSVKELSWLRMPSDQEFAETGTVGIYVGNFFNWDPNVHTKAMIEEYGFEAATQPFERTYRIMSNLDDMHENGIHDYMKFIKFGYGRASDHASKDIRSGYMSRNQGIDIVKKYDHVKPCRDLDRWLEYVGMSENEFDQIADNFRDPRVWWIESGQWYKHNVWGGPSAYGPVHLTDRKRVREFEDNAHCMKNAIPKK
jgi:N-acetyl sugar amidotransferase